MFRKLDGIPRLALIPVSLAVAALVGAGCSLDGDRYVVCEKDPYVAPVWAPTHGHSDVSIDVVEAPVTGAPVAVVPRTGAPDVAFFYEALAGHGAWIVVDGVEVWRPTVAITVTGWRPYCDGGYWLYTDLGWAWHSSYVWGWVPFHYGRWAHHPHNGWIWYPGTEWAPAWVDWRVCDDHYGWAPLPPYVTHAHVLQPGYDPRIAETTYVFVRREHFRDPHLRTRCLPRAVSATVYTRTTRIAGNYALRGGRVSNRGPDLGAVKRSATSSPRAPIAAASRAARTNDSATVATAVRTTPVRTEEVRTVPVRSVPERPDASRATPPVVRRRSVDAASGARSVPAVAAPKVERERETAKPREPASSPSPATTKSATATSRPSPSAGVPGSRTSRPSASASGRIRSSS